MIVWDGPVNPAQVIAATGADSVAVRPTEDGGYEVDADVGVDHLLSALHSITFDATFGVEDTRAQQVEQVIMALGLVGDQADAFRALLLAG